MKVALTAAAAAALLLATVAAPQQAEAHWALVHHRYVWVQDRHLEWRYWHPAQRHYWHAHHYPYYR